MNKENVIENLKGIGGKTAELYHKVGIYTYGDLMYYFPRDYASYEVASDYVEEDYSKKCFIKGKITSRPLLRRAGRMTIVSAVIRTQTVEINAVWFNMPYLPKSINLMEEYVFVGYVEKVGNRLKMEQPAMFTVAKYEEIIGTLQPIYPLTKGLTNNSLKKSISLVLDEYSNDASCDISDYQGNIIRENDALFAIHFPKDIEELKRARSFLVFDEFFMFMLRLRFLKEDNDLAGNDFYIKESKYAHELLDKLPYSLTNAQKKVFEEIECDLISNKSMSRLVQGDVGCGKTIIAILACINVAEYGYQCAFMAPTEILARQHYDSIREMFEKYNIPFKVTLLTGSMTAKQKKEECARIEGGEVSIIVGTHALIQDKVVYNRLALVITDEQHRFGVKQRQMLADKNALNVPHVLVMSATPIPRTLAIMMYGDLDISIIDELPKNRIPIKNCVVGKKYRKKSYDFILKEIKAGHQAYVICPMVEETEGLDCEDVISYSKKLKEAFPPEITIEYLHGKMKPAEKDRIMNDFLLNRINILVSTTVVEVGVNVPNATVMMIENAERFGLAQLHQLRGRIGRGSDESYCIFINGKESNKNKERLDILNKSNDGFYIASKDLELRGPGDMFGIRQSGEMSFRLGDIFTDAAILKEASRAVDELLSNDRYLEAQENTTIKKRLTALLNDGTLKAL